MWVIFLEINPTFERAYQAATELGLRTLLISSSDESFNTQFSIDSYEKVEVLTFDSVVAILNRRSDIQEIGAFWALRDSLVPLASKLTHAFGTHKNAYQDELVKLTKNKIEMREALKATTYNPDYSLLVPNYKGTNPLPGKTVVLKPALGYASIGVEKVRPDDDFGSAFRRCSSVLEKIKLSIVNFESGTEYDASNVILVEEFIDGKEFSAELFASQNKIVCVGICGKSEMEPPYFEEISYCLPARTDDKTRTLIETAALEIMQTLGMKSGMAHVEFRMKEGRPIVLDIGLRLGGSGLTHELVHASSGIDLVKAVIAELCGLNSEQYLITTSQNIGLLYLVQVGRGGCVGPIPDFQSAIKHCSLSKEFLWAQYFVKENDRLIGYPQYSGLPGFALFKVKGQDTASYQRAQEVLGDAAGIFRLEFSQ